MQQRVAFIGLGAMGEPMAANLLKKGFSVGVVGHRRPDPVSRLRALGATVASTPAEAMRDCDIAILMLPNSCEVERVITGPHGLLETAPAGSVIVDCSTSDPECTRRLSAMLAERKVGFVDAPVTRGVQGAQQGKLAYFISGAAADLEKAKPCLEAMGDTFHFLGAVGAGHATKIISNVLSYGTVALVNEALMLGKMLGLDLNALQQALMSGSGSKALESFGPRIVAREYRPARVKVGDACQHMDIAGKLALSCATPQLVSAAAREVFCKVSGLGHGGDDLSSVAEIWPGSLPESTANTGG